MEFFSPSAENDDFDMSSSLTDLYKSTHRSMFPHIQLQMESTQVSDTATDSKISIDIRPLLLDLDPGLLLRLKRFAKGMKQPSKFEKFNFGKPKKVEVSKGHKIIQVDAPSIDLRVTFLHAHSLLQSDFSHNFFSKTLLIAFLTHHQQME